MKYIRNTTDFYIEEETVLSLGKFDGIHRGHEILMKNLSAKKAKGLSASVFTFDIPPQKNVSNTEIKVLTTNREKMYIFEKLAVDYLIECPFVPEIMYMAAEDFIEKIVRQMHVKCMVVGEDFRFGYKRRGDYQMLVNYGKVYGYETLVVKKIQEDGRDISSTFVREEIIKGNLEKANQLLGYHYFVRGTVEYGNQIGRTICIPTANQLPPREKLLPPNGVYLTEIFVDDKKYHGVTNVGCKPTIGEENPVGVETHILDFHEDIYGHLVTVEFLHRIREERKFASVEALKEQLQNDIAFGKRYFAKNVT